MLLSREEFEDWLEDHREEALERIEVTRLPLARWVVLYAKSLTAEVREQVDEDEVDEELDGVDFEEEEGED